MTLTKSQILMLLLLASGSSSTIGMEMKTFHEDCRFLMDNGLILITTVSAPVVVTKKGLEVINKYVNLEV